jgi:hypothetical protein
MAPITIKQVGSNGQITLGKKWAGRQVLVEEQEPGVWLVRTAQVIPDNERWAHQEPFAGKLRAALEWAEKTPRRTDNSEEILDRLRKSVEEA